MPQPGRSTDSRSRQESADQPSTPATRFSGGGRPGQRSSLRRSAPSTIGTAQRALHAHQPRGADAPQERQRVVVAAEQHVLAVVDPLAAGLIARGEGPAAEHRARFDDQHAHAGVGEGGRRAQAGASRPDHHHVDGGHDERAGATASTPARISVRAQVVAAMSARCGRGTRTTSEKTS